MELKVLALGSKNSTRRVAQSLTGSGIEVVCQSNISEAVSLLKKEKFDLALVDSHLENLESICYRIAWQCRLPVVLIIKGTRSDWNLLRTLDVDGFIPEESGNIELTAYFKAIANRKYQQPEPIKVLIVEDDEQTQEAMRLAFQIYWPEATVVSANNGEDGVSFARRGGFDIALLDLKLPDISGHQVLDEIRTFSQMPVIVVTADRNQDDIIRCLNAGANEYIAKPFRQLELMSRIRDHVNFGAAAAKV